MKGLSHTAKRDYTRRATIASRDRGGISLHKEKLWTAPFLSIGSINFIQFLTQYVMVTTLPLFIMDRFHGTEFEAGLAMTFFQIGTSVFRPVAGILVDKENKKGLLIGTLIVFAVVIGGFNGIAAMEHAFGLRLLHGVLFSLATTVAAALAVLLIPPTRRGEGIGYFSVTTNLAMVVGPLVGLLLYSHVGIQGAFIILTIFAVAMVVMAVATPIPKTLAQPVRHVTKGPFWQKVIEKRSIPASILSGLVFFAYGGILTFLPLYATSIGLREDAGLFFVVFAVVIVITRPLIGNVFDHIGPSMVIYPGFVLFFVGFILFSMVQSLVPFLIAAAILGVGFGALSPAFQTLAIQSVPIDRAGAATATYFWFLDIFVGLSAIALGIVATMFGYSVLYGMVCPLTVIVTALGYFLLFTRFSHKNRLK